MNRPGLKQAAFTVIACALTAALLLFYNYRTQKKIAVVDAIKLVNAYKMKQELESKAAGGLKFLSHQVDSFKQELTVKSKLKDYPKEQLQVLYGGYVKAQQQLDEFYQQSNQSINEQVWKRLNPLIDQYGKEKDFRLIIGANGMGSVLYNDDYYDRTAELIEYVNKKYEAGS